VGVCQLEILRHCFPPSVRSILEELPDSLDETYERILREIRKPNQGYAHRLLQCLVVAARPLEVKELAEVLAFDFNTEGIPKLNLDWRREDQEEAVLSACSSLITIVNYGESRIVQFSHFSVKGFLTADRLRLAEPDRGVSRYHIRLDTAHTVLARACLGALLRLDDRVDQDKLKNFPLAHYSAQYWTTHARFQGVSSHIKDGMECLFDADKPHFSTWLWIYNNDQGGRSMSTIRPEKPEAVPLYYAASFGFLDLAEHLIAKHPEYVIAKGGKAVAAMHIAARGGYADILSLLLAHGADVDDRSLSGSTPLYRAAWNGKVDAGKCLLDHGANINARDNGELVPLYIAVLKGHVEFARMLLKRGAAIDARNGTGTSLHWAAQGGETQAVQLLLDNGARAYVNVRNKFDRTPSQSVAGPKRQEIVSPRAQKLIHGSLLYPHLLIDMREFPSKCLVHSQKLPARIESA
jgi:ankyrin repeat protein